MKSLTRLLVRGVDVVNAKGKSVGVRLVRLTRWRRTLQEAGLFSYSDPDHKIEYSRVIARRRR